MRLVAIVLVPLLASACRGGAAGGSDEAADDTGDASSSDGTGATDGEPAACAGAEALAVPLRRLTRREYDATVRDLVGSAVLGDLEPASMLPTDAAAKGFDTAVSTQQFDALLAQGYMDAAEAVAARAVADLDALLPCDPAQTGEVECVQQLVDELAPRAFRRPLDTAERDRYHAFVQEAHAQWGVAKASELLVSALLQSPAFLFRPEIDATRIDGDRIALGPYELATRLSYLLWGTMPDAELFAAAAEDRLGTSAELAAQAERMLADPRARELVAAFHAQWLRLGTLDTIAKDGAAYPLWSDALRDALRDETLGFVDHVVFDAEGDLATMLSAPYTWGSPEVAALYGVAAADADVGRIDLPPDQRAGLLTHGSVLAATARRDQSSPVLRGVWIREQIMCESLPQPPADVDTTPPEVDPDASTRDRFEQHTSDPACATCHRLIDPIGFGLEHYDGIGGYRTVDGGVPVDASGLLVTDNEDVAFDGAIELAALLAEDPVVHQCFVTKWFEFAHGRAPDDRDSCTSDALVAQFATDDGDVRRLLVALTQAESFRFRPAIE